MDLGGVFLAVCALSLVCLGSLAVLAFIAFRLAGRGLGGAVQDIVGGDYVEGLEQRENLALRRDRPAFRRDESSFDEALRRYGGQGQSEEGTGRSIPRANSPFNRGGDGDGDSGSLRGRSAGSKKRRDDYEIYDDGEGGFF